MTNKEKLNEVFPELKINGSFIYPNAHEETIEFALLGAGTIMQMWLDKEYKNENSKNVDRNS